MKKLVVGTKFKKLLEVSPDVILSDDLNDDILDSNVFGQGTNGNNTSINNLAPEDKRYIHKFRSENVLISLVERLSENEFKSNLLINNDNEMLLDHITGLHIPGIVVLEAARQISEVIINKYLIPYVATGGVINKFNNTFINFVFPLPTTIHATVNKIQHLENFVTISARIAFIQNNIECAYCDLEGNFYEQQLLSTIEKKKFLKALSSTLS